MALPIEENSAQVSEATKQRYFKSLQEQLKVLRTAMERSDLGTVREICHRVRGSASLFGLKDLGEACRQTEEACLNGDQESIVQGFQVIEVIVSRQAILNSECG